MRSNHSSGSGLWKHGLLLTLLFGFTVMLVGGFFIYKSRAPIPDRVLAPSGAVLFTAADIQAGQELFRKRDLMNYGAILGHGAYLGAHGHVRHAGPGAGVLLSTEHRPAEFWKEKWIMTGFWGLNAGLMGMILITLVPVGGLQAIASFEKGFWWARSLDFYVQPVVSQLLWLRMIPDTVFIAGGVLPLVAAALYGLLHLRQVHAGSSSTAVWVPDRETLVGAQGERQAVAVGD